MADYKPGSVPLAETDDRRLFCKYHYKGVLVLVIPLAFAGILAGHPVLVCRFLYMTICMYLFYILNLIGRGAVAFIYIVFIPIAGIADSKDVSTSYYPDFIFLVYGTIMVGAMMDSSRLSKHLGFIVIRIVGSSLKWLQVILACSVFVISVLVNPTMAAAVGMKVAQAVVVEYDAGNIIKQHSDEERYEQKAPPYPAPPAIAIYLTCCYTASLAASVSPFVNPNGAISIKGLKIQHLLLIMVAPAILGILVTILWLQFVFFDIYQPDEKGELALLAANKDGFEQTVADRKKELGPWNVSAKIAFVLILITFILLHTVKPVVYPAMEKIAPGTALGLSVPAIAMGILFFAVPANYLFCKYYVCREPKKSGTTPSLLSWKALNNSISWADIFMLGGAFSCVFCGVQSGFIKAVADAVVGPKHGDGRQLLVGICFGTLLSVLSPATTLARLALPVLAKVSSTLALSFATASHIQLLLPTSSAGNTIVAGWGNIRPYQFLLAGIVPTLFMMIMVAAFTWLLFDKALPT